MKVHHCSLLSFFVLAVSGSAQIVTIDEESCGEPTACQDNREGMNITIGGLSCNEENSCSSNSGDVLTVGEGSCNVRSPTGRILVVWMSISCSGAIVSVLVMS